MTKSEFSDIVASAFTEYFPKVSEGNRDDFIATLIDDLSGTDVELEDDEETDEPEGRFRRGDDEDY